jgi:hypothetical protein
VPLNPIDINNNFPQIEAPLRWLPENVQDDCSWMLMELDLLPYDDGPLPMSAMDGRQLLG